MTLEKQNAYLRETIIELRKQNKALAVQNVKYNDEIVSLRSEVSLLDDKNKHLEKIARYNIQRYNDATKVVKPIKVELEITSNQPFKVRYA